MPNGLNLIYMDLIGPNYSQLVHCGHDWLCDIRLVLITLVCLNMVMMDYMVLIDLVWS